MLFRNSHKKKQKKNTEVNRLSPDQADILLNNIIGQLEFEETADNKKQHSCYYIVMRKYILKNACVLCVIFLLLFNLMPGTVVPSSITNVSAATSDDMSSASVQFSINSLIPVERINATLNNSQLNIEQCGYQKYSVDVSENGYLLLEVYTMTGLYSSQGIQIDNIDDQAPHIKEHILDDGNIRIYLTDGNGTGVDYGSVSAYIPDKGVYENALEINEEEGYVVFSYPESVTYITVSDNNGNQMTAVLSPPEGSL